MEVDWAENTLSVYDEITGDAIPAYVFVASLSCSLYGYAEAFSNMKTASWINKYLGTGTKYSSLEDIHHLQQA
jgi:transposase